MTNCEGLRVLTDSCIAQNGYPKEMWLLYLVVLLLMFLGFMIGYIIGKKRMKK